MIGSAISTLDDDGNASFVFKGSSCASGSSTVIADVLAGTHPTYTTKFKILPRRRRRRNGRKGYDGQDENIGLVAGHADLEPNPVTEVGFTPSGDLSITKVDNDGDPLSRPPAGQPYRELRSPTRSWPPIPARRQPLAHL